MCMGIKLLSESEFCLTTSRLQLREFGDDDASALFNLNSDPAVLRYTGDTPFGSPAEALAFIRAYDHYRLDGFGRWAVTLRNSNEFIGFCGLVRDDETGEVDLAFRIAKTHWSMGYATEASHACLTAGFQTFGLDEIQGRAMRENLASITVLQKLGMKYRDMVEEQGDFWLVYSVDSDRFLSNYLHRL